MESVLLIFASTHGQTEKIVAKLASAIEAEGAVARIVNVEKESVDSLDSYDGVIVAGSIHAGTHQKDLIEWVGSNRAGLDARSNLFISVSMSAADDTDEAREVTGEYVEKFEEDTGWKPKRVEAVAGALLFQEYNVFTRILMKMIVRKKGHPADASKDHEFTDWDAVERIGREFAGS